jgi:hypothetical protein
MSATQQNSTITVISNYIKSTLIPSVIDIRSSNIFDHELTDLAGFPAATITLQDITGKILDNARNERTYSFAIRIFIDRNKQNFGSSKAETILRTMANNFILQVDNDPSLGGNAIFAKAFNIKLGYVDRESNNLRLFEVTLEVIDATTRS